MLVAAVAVATPALAQDTDVSDRDAGGFRNVLPAGQGETVNAAELARFTATGEAPDSFTDQLPLYNDLLFAAPSLARPDLDSFFKSAQFGVPQGQVASDQTERPRPGVKILRDAEYQVPHVFGETRADTMFGAGYATAQDRLFLMDVLRHTGRAELTELIGPGDGNSTVEMDAEQLLIADYSEAELRGMIEDAVAAAGAEGRQVLSDLRAYVDGINQYIAEARGAPRAGPRANPAEKLPAEYPALGETPEYWKSTDTVAVASLIGGIFGRGGGSEGLVSQALAQAEARFSDPDVARAVFEDFRREEDPEAPVTTTRRFEFDDPGEPDEEAVAVPELGSIEEEQPIKESSTGVGGAAAGPSWLQELQQQGLSFPTEQSNALLVPGERSASGTPLAVMGPQVGYFSPEILLELDLHGPGVDARGAAFPGISMYVLLGRGRDFAWSATTATTDNVDEFVEVLCEPGGGEPTPESNHYEYNGRCIPFETSERNLQTGLIPTDPAGSFQEYRLEVKRSVHGPIQARAIVDDRPVAIAEARSTYFHELESAVAFKRLNSNEVTGARSFQRAMSNVNFAFNWFYAGAEDVTFFQSGWFPRRAEGTDPSLPTLGTGDYDWQGFDPDTFLSDRMSFDELPKDTNPSRGYLVNWNNKQAPGWRAADDQLSYGSVHRSERLEDRVRRGLETGDGKLSVTELTQIMETGATVDLRGQEIYPLLRRVIGGVEAGSEAADLLDLLDAWGDDGFHRRDIEPAPAGNNVLEHSPAVAVFDEWWPLLVERMFEPVVGGDFVSRIEAVNPFGFPPDAGGSSYGSGWWGYVDKDLRTLLGDQVDGPLSRTYCGAEDADDTTGSLSKCREILLEALGDAAAEARQRYGESDVEGIERPATCEPDATFPRECDQIEFTTAGAVGVDPIHWQDRPTFQQVVDVGSDLSPGGDDGGGDGGPGPGGGGPGGGGNGPGGGGSGGGGGDDDDGGDAASPAGPDDAPEQQAIATVDTGSAAGAGDGDGLPFTGLPLAALLLAAAALLCGGTLLRRRAR